MSQCQFGLTALGEFMAFIEKFPTLEWHLWFIGTMDIDGGMTSLHGQPEMDDEILWLAIQALYPEKWASFLRKRAFSAKPKTEEIARNLGFDFSKLKAWMSKNGRSELARHYTRSMRMGINASPTLLVNNSSFSPEISTFRLASLVCGTAEGKTAYCDSLPECDGDGDCKKAGKIGKCVSKNGAKAVCEYTDATRFTLSIVLPDSSFSHPEYGVIAGIMDDFPGVLIDTVRNSSEKGKKLLADYNPTFLPFFIFDKTIMNAPNYQSIETGLFSVKNKLLFKPGMVKPSYFYKRKEMPKTCALYVDPVFPGAKDAIKVMQSAAPTGVAIRIMPIVYTASDSAGASAEETLRQEEALRWLVLMEKYPEKYGNYLKLYRERKNISYWFTDCGKLNINVDEFVKQVEVNSGMLSAYRKDIEDFGIKDPVEIIINNREVVAVKNQKEMGELIVKVGGR
jgi:hypothetical protein